MRELRIYDPNISEVLGYSLSRAERLAGREVCISSHTSVWSVFSVGLKCAVTETICSECTQVFLQKYVIWMENGLDWDNIIRYDFRGKLIP